ncbi:MAG: S-layer homology domain-containing protein [Anaerolineales bacterium]
MKKSRFFSLGALLSVGVIVLALSAFWAGNAYASTGCFNDTNGHWAETFICWMKDNNITTGIGGGNYGPEQFVTRAQMAVFMQRASNVPPSTGVITVSQGPGNWSKFLDTDPTSFNTYSTVRFVKSSLTGSYYISIHPTLPTILYGKSLQLTAVELCYTASATAYLDYVEINIPTHATAPAGGQGLVFSDHTIRTDSTCRYYALTTPVTLTADNIVNVFVSITWTNTTSAFQLGRTTFVLQPTSTTAVLPAEFSASEVTPLQEGGSADVPSTLP